MANPKNQEPHAQPSADEADSWVTLQDHRPTWFADEMRETCSCDQVRKAEIAAGKKAHIKGCGSQVEGFLLGVKMMNPSEKNVKKDRPLEEQMWAAVVIKLTVQTKAKSAEGDIREFDAGTEILVGGYDLGSVYKAAKSPRYAFQIRMWPTRKLDVGGGHKMFLFAKRINPVPVERTPENGLIFFEDIEVPALTAHETDDNEDPFRGAPGLPSAPNNNKALPQGAQG
jgi:hypothetical protein